MIRLVFFLLTADCCGHHHRIDRSSVDSSNSSEWVGWLHNSKEPNRERSPVYCWKPFVGQTSYYQETSGKKKSCFHVICLYFVFLNTSVYFCSSSAPATRIITLRHRVLLRMFLHRLNCSVLSPSPSLPTRSACRKIMARFMAVIVAIALAATVVVAIDGVPTSTALHRSSQQVSNRVRLNPLERDLG